MLLPGEKKNLREYKCILMRPNAERSGGPSGTSALRELLNFQPRKCFDWPVDVFTTEITLCVSAGTVNIFTLIDIVLSKSRGAVDKCSFVYITLGITLGAVDIALTINIKRTQWLAPLDFAISGIG